MMEAAPSFLHWSASNAKWIPTPRFCTCVPTRLSMDWSSIGYFLRWTVKCAVGGGCVERLYLQTDCMARIQHWRLVRMRLQEYRSSGRDHGRCPQGSAREGQYPFTPGVFNYETNIMADNVWNAIPTFNVDVVGIMMEWIMENGGMESMERMSIMKSDLMYSTIDNSNGFFGTRVEKTSGYRSRMNVPFCVASGDEALTDLFLVECWERGIVGLRTVTPFGKGIYLRASLYHGVAYDEVVVLTQFMKEFAARHSISKEIVQESTGVTSALEPCSPLFHHNTVAPHSPLFQEALDLSYGAYKGLEMMSKKLSTSPDTVSDTSFTWPKNMKVNQCSRVKNDMFAPPELNLNSPPPTL
mmetsp:Transcript_12821/g.27810  ORF Transcript_12821/g.27810 Transcript_12821/m.27810 type:complete len:355 (+) Transcript_12821:696-1760(+)